MSIYECLESYKIRQYRFILKDSNRYIGNIVLFITILTKIKSLRKKVKKSPKIKKTLFLL